LTNPWTWQLRFKRRYRYRRIQRMVDDYENRRVERAASAVMKVQRFWRRLRSREDAQVSESRCLSSRP
jgi:hypothetical protein